MAGGNAADALKDHVVKLEQLVATFLDLNELVSNVAVQIEMVEKSVLECAVNW